MQHTRSARRPAGPSRSAIVAASFAAVATFAAAVAISGLAAAPVADATATAPAQALAAGTTDQRVVVDTVYVVTARSDSAPALIATGTEHEGGESEEGDD